MSVMLTKILSIAFVFLTIDYLLHAQVIRVVKFSREGYKIRKIFALKLTYPKEIFGVLSKIGHHFSNKVS